MVRIVVSMGINQPLRLVVSGDDCRRDGARRYLVAL